jgi:hypothetical protein
MAEEEEMIEQRLLQTLTTSGPLSLPALCERTGIPSAGPTLTATERTMERWTKSGLVRIIYIDNEPCFGVVHASAQR